MKSFFKNYIAHIRHVVSHASRQQQIIFLVLAGLLIISALGLVWLVNKSFSVEIPATGGAVVEGVIGTPRFINPVLASSDVDRDLTALVYSGLMRRSSDGVSFIPDLAESYTVSDSGSVYTFTLRDSAKFHDGKPVTAHDVAFTIEKIQDSTIKSPWRIQWVDITPTVVDNKTITFALKKPYAGFLLATTVGILPKHAFESLTGDAFEFSKYNTHPIGSGPFKVSRVQTRSDGTPTAYTLSRFKRFVLGAPYLANIIVRFYPNEEELLSAFENKTITHIQGFPAEYAESIKRQDVVIREESLPRVFALFFNQSKNKVFMETAVTNAINSAIDREQLIRKALHGYGTALVGPLPPTLFGASSYAPQQPDVAKANELLEKAGWRKNATTGIREKSEASGIVPLQFTIATTDTPDLIETAESIKSDLNAIGIKVEIRLFGIGNLDRDVIRPREYEALLFGQVLRYDTDLYAFWHSSQRNDPGLNVSLYANRTVDELLEQALQTNDSTARIALYQSISDVIRKDTPAVFLYAPHLLFTIDRSLQGIEKIETARKSDRFSSVYNWYTKTDRVWKILAPRNDRVNY